MSPTTPVQRWICRLFGLLLLLACAWSAILVGPILIRLVFIGLGIFLDLAITLVVLVAMSERFLGGYHPFSHGLVRALVAATGRAAYLAFDLTVSGSRGVARQLLAVMELDRLSEDLQGIDHVPAAVRRIRLCRRQGGRFRLGRRPSGQQPWGAE